MDLMSLISKMITFIALMLVGYIGARRKLLDNAFARALSQLVMNLFLTCTVINSVISERPGAHRRAAGARHADTDAVDGRRVRRRVRVHTAFSA